MAELVFLHGAADSSAVWQRQVEHFARRHLVLALDLPGHGERLSELALDSVDQNAEEAVRVIDRRGFRRPILIGHSMGGATALTVAMSRPTLPRALVLVGSGARLRMRPSLIEEARVRAGRAAPGRVVERVVPLDQVVSPGASAADGEWLKDHFGRSTAQATYADFVATNGFDVMERLHQIRQPTLVVGGEDDLWTPPKFQSFLAERLPEARLILFPDAGHYPFVEREAAFNEEVERFLSDLGDG